MTSTNQPRRWVVVHNAARDQYQLPLALAESDRLDSLITDWYTPLNSPIWRLLARSKIGKSAMGLNSRFLPALPEGRIIDRKIHFVLDLIHRRITGRKWDDLVAGREIGAFAATKANKRRANILAASYCGAKAFENADPDLLRVLFQVHPQPRYLRNLYNSTIASDQSYSGLSIEAEMTITEDELQAWELETKLADFIICASLFTKRSLTSVGIPDHRIAVVPYGVDLQKFKEAEPDPRKPLTFLFTGQKVARKGLRTLLEVWKEVKPGGARLVVAGGHVRDDSILEPFRGLYEEIPRVGANEIVEAYQNADVFVLPSLAEGFGHVYLESLSCGTPIICTPNTGGADLIVDGESGWITPAADRAALARLIQWCVANPEAVRRMRKPARAVAEKHSWPNFRANLRAALTQFEQSKLRGQHSETSTAA